MCALRVGDDKLTCEIKRWTAPRFAAFQTTISHIRNPTVSDETIGLITDPGTG